MTANPWSLPSGWRWARFDEVASVASDLVDPADHPGSAHVAPNHIQAHTGKLLATQSIEEDGVTSPKHRFYAGQVLYSKIRPNLAKVVTAPYSGLCSADMYPLRTTLLPEFLKWWLLTPEFTHRASSAQGRTVLPKINKVGLYALPVPVPSIDEQRRIVTVLEDHLSRLDAAASYLAASRRRLNRLNEGLLAAEYAWEAGHATAALPAVEGVDDSTLPSIPASWTWRRLGEIADVVGGVTKDAKKQGDSSFVEVPYLRVANVQRGRLDLSAVTTIKVAPTTLEKLRLRQGDVLLNEGGDRDKLGRGWVWEEQIEDCIHQNHVFRARVRDDAMHPELLSLAANTIGGRWCQRNGTQSVNLASISLRKIKLMPVPVPPAAEQNAIAERVAERRAACAQLAASLTAAERRQVGLRKALLAAAFSGRLSGRSSDLDIAEELPSV